MSRFVSISKAARLSGVSAQDLQKLLQDRQLSTVRGMIHLDDLLDICPDVHLQETDMVEWVEQIKIHTKEHPEYKKAEELDRPELIAELNAAYKKLAFYQNRLSSLEHALKEARKSLHTLKQSSSEPNRVQSLIAWLDNKLNRP